MPRMSKKLKKELAFFLNERGRRSYNELCRKCQHDCKQSFRAVIVACPRYLSKRSKQKKEDTNRMEYEFMTIDTPLPPSMPLPRAMLRLPISSTAKIMYARMLDDVLANGIEDMNGILFICFPIVELSAALSRSTMTVKRSLNELEAAGLIVRVRQGFGEPNKIYVLIPRTEG